MAVPVHIQAELAGAQGAAGRAVTVRLISQTAEAPELPAASLSVPGQTVLEVPAGMTWQVLAEAPGLWSAPQWIAPSSGQGEQVVRLTLFPSATLVGALKMSRGSQRVSTIELRLQASPASRGAKPPATTLQCPVAAERFKCEVPAAKLDLRVRAAGFIPAYLWDVEAAAGQVQDLGLFPVKAGASVVGWVRTGDAVGVGGAQVRLEPQTLGLPSSPPQAAALKAMALETKANERGFFQFQEVTPGLSVVTVTKAGMAKVKRSGIEVRPDLEAEIVESLVLTPPLTLSVTLDPPAGPSGAAWKVSVERRDLDEIIPAGEAFRGTASLEGNWEQKGLNAGRYVLRVSDGETNWPAQVIELTPERTAFPISIPGVQLVGRAMIGKEPLEATLWFGGRKAPQRARFESDKKGNFSGLLPAEGLWEVELVAEKEGLRLRLDPVEVRKPPGKSHATVEIRAPNTRLRGRAVDESGNAVSKASLLVLPAKKAPSGVSTGSEGEFEVRGLAPGQLIVHAEKDDRESEWLEAHVEEDVDTPELKVVLRPRLSIQGRVFSPSGPVPGARVMVRSQVNEAGAGSAAEAVTGPAGEFTVKLPAGSQLAHVSVLAPGYAIRMLLAPLGPEPVIEIPMEQVGGVLVFDLGGRTLDEALSARAGLLAHAGSFVPFQVAAFWARLQRAPQHNPHRLVLPNMEAGDYLLCLGPEAQVAVPRGQEPPGAQCSRGSLAPLQELTLALPGR